jgi:hypothetical protein
MYMATDTDLLIEIRDLLQVLAEPLLAKRDENVRAAIRKVVGKSTKAQRAVMLMDGSRSQANIAKEASMDAGNLTRLVRSLEKEQVCSTVDKQPKLVVQLPQDFFRQNGDENE